MPHALRCSLCSCSLRQPKQRTHAARGHARCSSASPAASKQHKKVVVVGSGVGVSSCACMQQSCHLACVLLCCAVSSATLHLTHRHCRLGRLRGCQTPGAGGAGRAPHRRSWCSACCGKPMPLLSTSGSCVSPCRESWGAQLRLAQCGWPERGGRNQGLVHECFQ